MKIENPHRDSGKFLTVDMLAALAPEVKRSRSYHEMLVNQGRMKLANFKAKIGALEAIVVRLQDRLLRESRAGTAEEEGEAFIIYLPDADASKEFLKWAEERKFPVSCA